MDEREQPLCGRYLLHEHRCIVDFIIHRIMKRWVGKDERINGVWYPVTVYAESVQDANRKLYVGKKKSYGIVEAVRGRWTLDD